MTMTRDEATSLLYQYKYFFEHRRKRSRYTEQFAKALGIAIKALLVDSEWIPCSEKLPKEDARYLCQNSHGLMSVLSWANNLEDVDNFHFYNKNHGGWYELDSEWGCCERRGVIAWKPLPKPYKEDGEA